MGFNVCAMFIYDFFTQQDRLDSQYCSKGSKYIHKRKHTHIYCNCVNVLQGYLHLKSFEGTKQCCSFLVFLLLLFHFLSLSEVKLLCRKQIISLVGECVWSYTDSQMK